MIDFLIISIPAAIFSVGIFRVLILSILKGEK